MQNRFEKFDTTSYQEIILSLGVFRCETASGFYPFGDATDLAGEGGVGDVVWLIQASAWNQTCHTTNNRCEALASLKGCFFYVFVSVPQYFSAEPKIRLPTKFR
ncbi:MAG: hypothetical protein SPD46_09915 [Sodaliphilus sp.]|nr:hypothetical protein [Sodaliphilus sp.]